MPLLRGIAPAALCLLVLPLTVQAAPIALANASFESLVLADGTQSSVIAGWTRFLTVATRNPTTAELTAGAFDGDNVAMFSGGATLTQIVGPLEYGTYTLTAAIGDPLGVPRASLALSLRRGTSFLSPASTSFVAPADGGFSLLTIVYEVTAANVNGTFAGEAINIFALSNGSGAQVALDNVQLDLQPLEDASPSPVPEPASLGLLGAGALLLEFRRRRALKT